MLSTLAAINIKIYFLRQLAKMASFQTCLIFVTKTRVYVNAALYVHSFMESSWL
jgi:hypothetical protein